MCNVLNCVLLLHYVIVHFMKKKSSRILNKANNLLHEMFKMIKLYAIQYYCPNIDQINTKSYQPSLKLNTDKSKSSVRLRDMVNNKSSGLILSTVHSFVQSYI